MVSCSVPDDTRQATTTTSCVVQKVATQTRITFHNLSASLTVEQLYKYVQLHLDEIRPFELTLKRGTDENGSGGGGDGGDVADLESDSIKQVRNPTNILCE